MVNTKEEYVSNRLIQHLSKLFFGVYFGSYNIYMFTGYRQFTHFTGLLTDLVVTHRQIGYMADRLYL